MSRWIIGTVLAIVVVGVILGVMSYSNLIPASAIIITAGSFLFRWRSRIAKGVGPSGKPLIEVLGVAVAIHLLASYLGYSNYSAIAAAVFVVFATIILLYDRQTINSVQS